MPVDTVKCQYCRKIFSSPASCDRHVKGVHLKIKPFKCSVCGLTFAQKVNRDNHQLRHRNDGTKSILVSKKKTLPVSKKRSLNTKKLNENSKKTAYLGDVGLRTCDVCQKVFSHRFVMLRHRRTHQSEKEVAMSASTDKATSVSQSGGIKKRMNKSQQGKVFSCDICQKISQCRNSLRRHRKVHFQKKKEAQKYGRCQISRGHVDEVKHRCDICNKVFAFKVHLLYHQKLHNAKDDSPVGHDETRNSKNDIKSSADRRKKHSSSNRNKSAHSQNQIMASREKASSRENAQLPSKPRIENSVKEIHEDTHVASKPDLVNDQEMSKNLSDSKIQEVSEAGHVIKPTERRKIKKMMKSTGNSECLICHRNYATHRTLSYHIREVHLKLRPHKCDLCGFTFKQRQHLVKHKEIIHSTKSKGQHQFSNRESMLCPKKMLHPIGSKTPVEEMIKPRDRKKIDQMMKSTVDSKCLICHKKYANCNVLRHHIREIHLDLRPFKCEVCGSTFKQSTHLMRHEKMVHSNKSNGQCPSSKRKSMLSHKKMLHPLGSKRPVKEPMTNMIKSRERRKIDQMLKSTVDSKCLICHKGFSRHQRLRMHIKEVHLNLRPHKCEVCGFTFKQSTHLARHKKRVHSTKGNGQHPSSNRKNKLSNKMIDPIGSSQVKDNQTGNNLPESKLETESGPEHISDPDEREKIDWMLASKSRDSKCLICNQRFTDLRRHVNIIHLKIRPHKCTLCDYDCSQKAHLKSHMLKRHSSVSEEYLVQHQRRDSRYSLESEGEYNKQLAGRSPSDREKIDQMMKSTVDSRCLICHKKYSNCQALRHHIRAIHLNLRPFRCEVCGSTFKQSTHLLTHKKLVHSNKSNGQYLSSNRKSGSRKKKMILPIGSKKPVKEPKIGKTQEHELVLLNSSPVKDHQTGKNFPVSKVETESGHEHISDPDKREKIERMLASKSHDSKCLICNQRFTDLRRHVNGFHLKIRPHKCTFCDYACNQKPDLKYHMLRKHSSVSVDPSVQAQRKSSRNSLEPDDKYDQHLAGRLPRKLDMRSKTCSFCSKEFSQRWTMLRHERQYHVLELKNSMKENEPIYGETEMTTTENSNNDEEINRGIKMEKVDEAINSAQKSQCHICSEEFTSCPQLKLHVKIVHRNQCPFICDACGFGFQLKCNLKRHVRRKHPFLATNQSIKSKSPESSDMKHNDPSTKKAPLKDIKCDICMKSFITNFSMLRHKRIHMSDNVLQDRAPPNLHEEYKEISLHYDENLKKISENIKFETCIQLDSTSSGSAVEILSSPHCNSSRFSRALHSQAVSTTPAAETSNSSVSVQSDSFSPKIGSFTDRQFYQCTQCSYIFTNPDSWREHLLKHLNGGTKTVILKESVPMSKEGVPSTQSSFSYTCPSCKVEVYGSLNLVMHIKQHMVALFH